MKLYRIDSIDSILICKQASKLSVHTEKRRARVEGMTYMDVCDALGAWMVNNQ